MAKLKKMKKKESINWIGPPDLFRAAVDDNVLEMEAALDDGQSLSEQRPSDGMTPVHLAAAAGSCNFISYAADIAPENMWIRDFNDLRPYEHALARRDRLIMTYISNAMYPELQRALPIEP